MNIENIVLADPVNKWFFKRFPSNAYLVGGYLRDVLTGKTSRDRDFVLPSNVHDAALICSREFNGRCIELKKNITYRVILHNTESADFNAPDGDLENDLRRRDMTINSMAWSPSSGLIDMCSGMYDLRNGIVRMIDQKNLRDDPLRMLRVYRIAAEKDFNIDPDTRAFIRHAAVLIKKSASERITEEFIKLLNIDHHGQYIQQCYDDKLLHHIIDLQSFDISTFRNFVDGLERLKQNLSNRGYCLINGTSLSTGMKHVISQGVTSEGLIRLSQLIGELKDRKGVKIGSLKPSRLIWDMLWVIGNSKWPPGEKLSDSRLFEIFSRGGGDAVFELSIILAVHNYKYAERFIHKGDVYNEMKGNCILSGQDILNALNIFPGPEVGVLKRELFKLQYEGKIKNREEAFDWIMSNLT